MGRRLRLGSAFFLATCVGLILFDNLVNIGRTVEELTKFYIFWRLTPLDFALLILFSFGAYRFRRFQKYLWRPSILFFAGATAFETIVGAMQPVEGVSWLLYDVRILSCLLGGVIMGAIMVRTGKFLRLVALFTLVTTALFIYAGVSTAVFATALEQGIGTTRVIDPNIYYYWEFLLIPCGILGVSRSATTYIERSAFWISLAALFFLGVVVTATRSCLIVLTIMNFFLFLTWIKRIEFKGIKTVVKTSIALGSVAIIGFFIWALFRPSERSARWTFDWQSFTVVDRVKDADESDETLNYRGQEVRQLLSEMRPFDYLIGKGLGSTIAVSEQLTLGEIALNERTPSLHVSMFNFLLKYGAGGFLFVVALSLFKWPGAFGRALLSRGRDRATMAVLACYPAVGAATSLMFMSGGFTPQLFLWFGVIYVYYIDSKLNGTKAIDSGVPKNSSDSDSSRT